MYLKTYLEYSDMAYRALQNQKSLKHLASGPKIMTATNLEIS